ncbi:MAG: prephenate dehydrogenase [Sulfurimonas sp. RIFOXYD12_FULL_33_39]|uniref:prephenate dehydrogenase n=1 Tax=unclassified Sulfurimonas TaxID=2623549 RepID=UPI0008B0F1A9|nr:MULTISPECIES: prephenate dehydrogenase [unclassified Sulfurimonas]OHE07075.1 MAG: prephenate dehydrogenase [Sulfurimonas sp. RIFCSPLOWO2_12_FULL_34_6]OHE10672.1 MAG: prephenate dehydrogenase [Sulfurimonas sp. RIFOXYD12_FULL_33_39]OHE13185.1 MAG: prephenate dehydrogenase [Sulfurimonas sp. RIFOXYD2_FULL_34_21]DAB27473.1 MAG TPA: prephenate dehydrogenase [Sulfurimonas sp. UBA10385]
MNIAIVGLGLMGGSLAKSLKKLDFVNTIVGSDHNETHRQEAIELGLVDKIVDFDEVKNYDVIFLAIPVDGVIAALKNLTDVKENTTIIDLGSTKAKIISAVPPKIRKNFVAAHPMTGTENFGPKAAIDDLYKDKVVVLCNLEKSGETQADVAKKIFKALEMKKYFMSAKSHDRHAAFISHMPHAISYSLANTVMHQENKHNILALAAGGFRSMSRLAKSSANMWEDIFRQNKENLLEAIELFEDELKLLKEHIRNEEWDKVHKNIESGNRLHDILD